MEEREAAKELCSAQCTPETDSPSSLLDGKPHVGGSAVCVFGSASRSSSVISSHLCLSLLSFYLQILPHTLVPVFSHPPEICKPKISVPFFESPTHLVTN